MRLQPLPDARSETLWHQRELEIQAGGRISGDIDVFGAPDHAAAETRNDDIAGATEPVAAEPGGAEPDDAD